MLNISILQRPRRVTVLCEYVFRGIKNDQPYKIRRSSCLTGYELIPKHEECNYTAYKTQSQVIAENIVPNSIEFPPLLKALLIENGNKNPKLPLAVNEHENHINMFRVAKEGETPTRAFEDGYGTPRFPNLLKSVNYDV